jgi:hypothetical protein
MIMIRILFLMFFAFPVMAQDKLEKLPDVETLDINTFVSNAQKIEKTYKEDTSLDFVMEIPKNFIVVANDKLKNNVKGDLLYGEIFNAYGPAIEDVIPYISMRSIELKRLISAKNWFVSEVLNRGYTLRGFETDDREETFDAFYIRLDNVGRTEIVRGRGFLNENRLVLVEYVIPTLLWQSDRDVQIFAMKSFEFAKKYKISSPEKMMQYTYLDSFYTEFPNSWAFDIDIGDAVNRLDINLKTTDRDRFIFSTADVTVVSSRSLKDRLDKKIYPVGLPDVIKERQSAIALLKYEADNVLERPKLEVGFETLLNVTEVYPLRKKMSENYVAYGKNPIMREFWMTVIRTPKDNGKNYVFSMVMPPRGTNIEKWALSVATYRHMIESLR